MVRPDALQRRGRGGTVRRSARGDESHRSARGGTPQVRGALTAMLMSSIVLVHNARIHPSSSRHEHWFGLIVKLFRPRHNIYFGLDRVVADKCTGF